MAFVNISAVRSVDPANLAVAKDSFRSSDPFAIILDVQVDSSLVSSGLLYDVVWQMVNPREDLTHAWWTVASGNIVGIPTVTVDWKGVAFTQTYFWVWCSWSSYGAAVSHLRGPDQLDGVFYVQGTVNVQGSSLFAKSERFWYKVRP